MTSAGARAREALTGILALGLGTTLLERLPSALALPSVASRASTPVDTAPPPRPSPPASSASAPSGLPTPVASYKLEARLDAQTHRIDGKGTLVFVNRTESALPALYFHLYLNAFKNEKSVFLRSPFGEARSNLRAEDWGYIDVRRCVARELSPDDIWRHHTPGNADDVRVMFEITVFSVQGMG